MRPGPAALHDPTHPGRSSDGTRRIVAHAPTRIDFGGGWTDVPPYPERDGGFVCNLAIDRRARVQLLAGTDASDGSPLAEAALRRAGVRGAVSVSNDFPVGAGLGGSSAAGVALQAALARLQHEHVSRKTLVRRSRAVEVEELGVAGGWQDHYAAAYGGALGLEFGLETTVRHLALARSAIEALERRCLIVYTGETRISGANISAVLDAYGRREPRVLHALQRMAALARLMAGALAEGDVAALGTLVGEHWQHQRALHPAITTPRIDALVERAGMAGALGTKALGASGGGCVLVVTDEEPEPVRAAVAPLGQILHFGVDLAGVTVEDVA